MNPWDPQSERVYGADGVWHSLNANESGGQSRDAVCYGFKLGQGEKAHGMAFKEEQSPTLNAECGGNKPAVLAFSQNGSGEVVISENSYALSTRQNPCGRGTGMIFGFQPQAGGKTTLGIEKDKAPTLGTTQKPAIYIQGNCIDRADTTGCNGKGWNDEDVNYALNTIDRPAVYDGSRRHNYQPFGEVCGTVQAQFGTGGNNTPLVVGSVWDARGNGDGETVPTMTGDHNNRVTDYTAICINGPVTGTLDASYYKGTGARNGQERPVVYCIGNGQADNTDIHDKCLTLSTMHDQQAVMVTAVDCRNGRESEVNGTLQAKGNGGTSLNLNNVCRKGTMVRRLTPLECERLQGYPDGWVFIGDWTDENDKKHKEADAPMYKALGNSIALPFWYWLLKRISDHCEEKTMGSLFSGIGGFDLCWQMINGEGSVKFSSEIEPFCVAVMKRRFGDEERSIKGNWMNYVK